MSRLTILAAFLAVGCVVEEEAPDAQIPSKDARKADVASDAAMDAAPVVDAAANAHCGPPLPLETCFQSQPYADCVGASALGHDPELYCRDGRYDSFCLWFADGCPAEGFERHCPDGVGLDHGYPYCHTRSMFEGWGPSPWDADRAMNVPLRHDPAFDGGDASTERRVANVSCGPCAVIPGAAAPEGWEPDSCGYRVEASVCPTERQDWVTDVCAYSQFESGWVSHVTFVPCEHLGAYALVLELGETHARACIVEASDAEADWSREPLCATGGEVVVNNEHGRFELTFPDYSPWPASYEPFVTGVEVSGTF